MDEPLIYTTRGNLPISQLTHKPQWEFPDSGAVVFINEYFLGEESVKREVNVYVPQGLDAGALAGNFS